MERLQQLETGNTGEREVEQYYIGIDLAHALNGFLPVTRFCRRVSFFTQQCGQHATDVRLVVDDQYGCVHLFTATGTAH
jgi:hypothetical protein